MKRIVIPILLLLSLTGCWDRVEIEDRGFVVGIAIDLAEDEGQNQQYPNYLVKQQIVVPAALQATAGAGDGGGGSQKPYFNITGEGETMFKIVREFATRASRTSFYEHLSVIILSEEVATSGLIGEALDIYLRDHEMRRGVLVMIAEKKASPLLEVASPNEQLPSMYIDSLAENEEKNLSMIPKVRIGDINAFLLEDQNFVLPRVLYNSEHEVKMSGAAAFNGNAEKMIGFLNHEETMGLNFITNHLNDGVLEVPFQERLSVYELINTNRQIEANVDDKNNMTFTIHIKAVGNLGETHITQDFLNTKALYEMETQVEKEITRLVNKTIESVQSDLSVDVLGLDQYLRQNHFSLWKTIKDDWDEGENYFEKSNITVEVDATVKNIGVINKMK